MENTKNLSVITKEYAHTWTNFLHSSQRKVLADEIVELMEVIVIRATKEGASKPYSTTRSAQMHKKTVLVVVNMHDRLGRGLVLLLDNAEKCVTATWIEELTSLIDDDRVIISNVDLYSALQGVLPMEKENQ
jgi:hypothetical protein